MRPSRVCYCAQIERIDTKTRVVLLQHRREREVAINTARIAHLALPNSSMHVGVDFTNDAGVKRELTNPERPAILLFPGDGAIDLREAPPAAACTLVVLDGTWWQARKLFKTNAFLRVLPRYAFAPSEPSRYRIRREPEVGFVSTIEALATAVGILEGDEEKGAKLLVPFDAMVETQLAHIATDGTRRTRHARVYSPKPKPVPAMFRARWDDLVIAYGEANAWPRTAGAPPYPPEIVQWVALRVATGERFEAIVKPTRGVSESFAYYTGVPRQRIASGEPFEAFHQRWRAFARGSDVVCTWGTFAANVLEAQGVNLTPWIDARVATIRHFGGRKGDMSNYVDALGGSAITPWAEGRAGLRIAELEAIARGLRGHVDARRATTANLDLG